MHYELLEYLIEQIIYIDHVTPVLTYDCMNSVLESIKIVTTSNAQSILKAMKQKLHEGRYLTVGSPYDVCD